MHRSGECLAVPVYYRKIRWSSICIDLSGISGAFGAADHGHGIAVGRASQASVAMSFDRLEPLGTKWHWYKWFGMAGKLSPDDVLYDDRRVDPAVCI